MGKQSDAVLCPLKRLNTRLTRYPFLLTVFHSFHKIPSTATYFLNQTLLRCVIAAAVYSSLPHLDLKYRMSRSMALTHQRFIA